jgi:hypothetical protein
LLLKKQAFSYQPPTLTSVCLPCLVRIKQAKQTSVTTNQPTHRTPRIDARCTDTDETGTNKRLNHWDNHVVTVGYETFLGKG